MKFKSTLKNFKEKMMITALAVLFSSLFTGMAIGQTYVNGNLSTGATLSGGGAAPAGFTWSELQLTNTTLGAGNSINNFTLADDFTVPAGPSWIVSKITFYAYSTGYVGATSPFNDIRVQLFNTDPSVGSPAPIFGDLTTNRLAATSTASMYRASSAGGTTRQIWKIEATVATTLAPGSYWVEWSPGTVAGVTSNFSPPSTVVGTITQAGNNAKQKTWAGVWTALTDGGSATPQDMHFRIDYATGPCSGTPAPGNTIASASPICPGSPSTLSLQNQTPGSGITYQWQSGSSASGPWTNITGANANTYVATPSVSTFYRCAVACGANVGNSTPVEVVINPPSACYCIPPTSNCNLGDIITNVTFGSSLNNTSTCSTNGYINYTATVPATNIVAGGANPMSVTVGNGGTEYVGVWIDYDKSGSFEAAEFTLLGSGNNVTITNNIVVPGTAPLGVTRMRVRVRWNTTLTGANACLGYTYGETEDYLVNLTACVQGVFTTQPTNKTIQCGGNTTFNIAATGSLLTYKWQYRVSATAPWLFVPTGGVYSGETTNTLTITNAPISMNGYQYRVVMDGACTATEFSSAGTLTVNQMVATVSPASAAICLGAVQQLTLTNILSPTTFNTNVSSGPIVVPIPDNTPVGVTTNLNVTTAQVPAGAAVTAMALRINLPHTWMGDLIFALKAPNGNIVNLNFLLGNTGPAGGGGFVNTVISSTGTTALSAGFGNWTGTFRPDYATGVNGGPTGYTPTVTNFSGLYSTPQGTWTLAVWDAFSGDVGTITSWSLDFTYLLGTPATGVWSGPAGTIFTDMAATTPYTGAAANSVYVKPTVTSNYSVVVTTPTCVSGSTTIPVSVSTPVGAITQPVATRTICVGANTTFTASALGGPLTTQWQVSTDAGATYSNVANAGVYSGATTNTLAITGATASMSGYRYRLAFNSAICSSTANSNAGILTVNPTPIIVLSVNPLTALYPGQTTTLSAAVSPNAGATYTWFRNGVVVAGATANTLTRDVDGLGVYSVRVTDVNGCTSTSNTREITDAANDILFIYPSPNTGQFQVRYYSGAGNNPLPRVLNIYDDKGSRIFSKRYTVTMPYTRLDVNLSNHGRGIYNVELADGNGNRLKTGRVVIF